MELILEDYLVKGSHVGDSDEFCYCPVFIADDDSKIWYFGNMFLNDYYVVFDMTPYTERGENYMQMGFGKQTKTSLVLAPNGGDKYDEVYGSDEESGGGGGAVFWVFFFLILIGGGGYGGYWWKFKRVPKEPQDFDEGDDKQEPLKD